MSTTSDDERVSDNVTVRIYQPAGFQSTAHSRPAVVFYHGGGWVTGNLDTEDHLCRIMCGRADVVVVSGSYRKFPSIRFPENIQDCYDGFQWVRRDAFPHTRFPNFTDGAFRHTNTQATSTQIQENS
jgi:acetyl esterase/lipase